MGQKAKDSRKHRICKIGCDIYLRFDVDEELLMMGYNEELYYRKMSSYEQDAVKLLEVIKKDSNKDSVMRVICAFK